LLNEEITRKQGDLTKVEADLKSATEKRSQLETAVDAVKQQNPGTRATVQYFPRTAEGERVKGALAELGFKITTGTPQNKNAPTNTVWFGRPVLVSDVKLVAYALVRSGFGIKCIQPFSPKSKFHDDALIQVGGYNWPSDKKTLTIDEIRAARDFVRCTSSGE
jgi:hypothetical protein